MPITNYLQAVPAKLQEVYDAKMATFVEDLFDTNMTYLKEIVPEIRKQLEAQHQGQASQEDSDNDQQTEQQTKSNVVLPKTPSHRKRQRPRRAGKKLAVYQTDTEAESQEVRRPLNTQKKKKKKERKKERKGKEKRDTRR